MQNLNKRKVMEGADPNSNPPQQNSQNRKKKSFLNVFCCAKKPNVGEDDISNPSEESPNFSQQPNDPTQLNPSLSQHLNPYPYGHLNPSPYEHLNPFPYGHLNSSPYGQIPPYQQFYNSFGYDTTYTNPYGNHHPTNDFRTNTIRQQQEGDYADSFQRAADMLNVDNPNHCIVM
ncbi:hypothetical protein VNO77_39218 [Canavalia gladiata]|uniref:Uncharacterized protein n=1 Tax=Canavalia gladiata TaxID=3824 RepID=A0AAN9KAP5_CANGL